MSPEDDDLAEVAKKIGARLIARRDAYAVQEARGGYSRRSGKMKLDLLTAHLVGGVSIGHYLIDLTTQTTKMFAFDIDPDDGDERDAALAGEPEVWARMLILAHSLCEIVTWKVQCRPMVSYGGSKGVHVICPIKGGADAGVARKLAEALLYNRGFGVHKGANFWKSPAWPGLTLEIFPKQADVDAGGFGNLMRLPLGVNAKTQRPAYFVPEGITVLGHPDDPLETLARGTFRS